MAERKTSHSHGAIDLMYFPALRNRPNQTLTEIQERCREPLDLVVDELKRAGLNKVFITQCKRWSCDRRMYCEDTQLDDVLRYTFPYPQHFIGIGGFNPLDIGPSIHEAETAIHQHGFRGIYVHPASFGVAINDRRMYPLFVKALDWQVPVILDVRQLADEIPGISPFEMEQVAADFPELSFVIAQTPWTSQELRQLADNCPNAYFCFDSASLVVPEVFEFLSSPIGRVRSMWGSNGIPWKEALQGTDELESSVRSKLLWETSTRVFGLDHLHRKSPKPYVPRSERTTRVVAE